jgi:hypothetical protein
VVRLGDVARLSLSHVPQWIRVNADGQDAVLLQVYQQPAGNSNAFLHGEYSREFVEMRRKHAAFLRMLPLTLVDWS